MTIEPSMPLPIERISDVQVHFQHHGEHMTPGYDAWMRASNKANRIIMDLEGFTKPIPQQSLDALAYWRDLAAVSLPSALEADSVYTQRDIQHFAPRREVRAREIARSSPNGQRVVEILRADRSFTDNELVDIACAHLGAVTAFLSTGDRRRFWPDQRVYAQNQVDNWEQVQDLETLLVVAKILEVTNKIDSSKIIELERLIAEQGKLYAEHHRRSRAIGLLSILGASEHSTALLKTIVGVMQEDRALHGDEYYQGGYQYAGKILRDPTLSEFQALLKPSKIPLITGAKREYLQIGDNLCITEFWDETDNIEAATSGGGQVVLPFTRSQSRSIYNRGTPAEYARYNVSYDIDYADLDPVTKARVIERLNEKPKTGIRATYHDDEITRIVFSIGYGLNTAQIPVEGAYIMPTLNPHTICDVSVMSGAIRELTPLGTAVMVSDYDEGYMSEQRFTYEDIRALAPDGANVFWFTCTPREVKLPDAFMTDQEAMARGVVVTPVQFYKATIDQVFRRR